MTEQITINDFYQALQQEESTDSWIEELRRFVSLDTVNLAKEDGPEPLALQWRGWG
jgi:hypothetical protein